MPLCRKCGEDLSFKDFTNSMSVCNDCWVILDMDRFKEARPDPKAAPKARILDLGDGSFGVLCPHCDWKILRKAGYFQNGIATERCRHCMKHFRVDLKEAR